MRISDWSSDVCSSDLSTARASFQAEQAVPMSSMKRGVGLSVFSSCLFAAIYYYATILDPLSGEEIFAWRVVLALPALALLITRARGWGEIRSIHGRLRREARVGVMLLVSAGLIGIQLWLFVWAPPHGKALDVSIDRKRAGEG